MRRLVRRRRKDATEVAAAADAPDAVPRGAGEGAESGSAFVDAAAGAGAAAAAGTHHPAPWPSGIARAEGRQSAYLGRQPLPRSVAVLPAGGPTAAAGDAGGSLGGPQSLGSEGGRTVVEKLRDRLDKLSLEAGVPIGAAVPQSLGKWLSGRPCPVDASRCAERVSLRDVELAFPFAPMPPQLQVAERVLEACDSGGVALLDSPTGTGKSIALMTAALAWQRRAYETHGAAPQIIYGVRTHAQLSQMVSELRKMPYRPRMAVIGSRDQLCISAEVRGQAARQRVPLNLMCRQAARRAVQPMHTLERGSAECACQPYAQVGGQAHGLRTFASCAAQGKLWDVEDLVQLAKSSGSLGGCPYYTAHVLAGDADIVFCPHNYVLDPAVSQCRSHHRERWSLDDRLVILDEAHNLEQGCRDAGSIETSLTELRHAEMALRSFGRRYPALRLRSRGIDVSCQDLVTELSHLPRLLAAALEALGLGDGTPGEAAVPPARLATGSAAGDPLEGVDRVWGLPGHPKASAFLQGAGLTGVVLSKAAEDLLVELTDRLLRLQVAGAGEVAEVAGGSAIATTAVAEDAVLLGILGRLQELLTKLRLSASHPDAYVLSMRRGSTGPLFAAWLMSPGVIFDTFALRARAVVLASGTLAPMAALSAELAPSQAFAARASPASVLEAAHVVAREQVLIATVGRFPSSGRTLVGTFDSWRRPDFLQELGATVASFVSRIPDGVLCFFPSYASLEGCSAAWKTVPIDGRPSVWAVLQRAKGAVVVEPRAADELSKVRDSFVAAVRSGSGALCLAVYRGKMSEGLSFDDALCRGILCLGVPYPQAKDPLVVAKRRWNDAARAQGLRGMLSGDHWYELQAFRAVNQALGRCIRHRFDHGALLLLDARWAAQGERSRGLRRHLARWLQPFIEDWPVALQAAGAAAHAGTSAVGLVNVGNQSKSLGVLWPIIENRLRSFFTNAASVVALRQAQGAAELRRTAPRPSGSPPIVGDGAGVPQPAAGRRALAGGALGLVMMGTTPLRPIAAALLKRPRLVDGSQSSDGGPVLPLRGTQSQVSQVSAAPWFPDLRSPAEAVAVMHLEAALLGERARSAALEEELRRRELACSEMAAQLAALRTNAPAGAAGV